MVNWHPCNGTMQGTPLKVLVRYPPKKWILRCLILRGPLFFRVKGSHTWNFLNKKPIHRLSYRWEPGSWGKNEWHTFLWDIHKYIIYNYVSDITITVKCFVTCSFKSQIPSTHAGAFSDMPLSWEVARRTEAGCLQGSSLKPLFVFNR